MAASEIYVYDDIGPEWAKMVGGQTIVKALAQCGNASQITVRINSGGGDVFEAVAIFNALKRHPAAITIEVDGLAASAASYIAMAGDRICMAQNSMMMVHNASSVVMGDRNEMQQMAAILSQIDSTLANTYAARTGLSIEKVQKLLDAETWMTADEAVKLGFADAVSQKSAMTVKSDLFSQFKNTPSNLKSAPTGDNRTWIDLRKELEAKRDESLSPLEKMRRDLEAKKRAWEHERAVAEGRDLAALRKQHAEAKVRFGL